MKTTALENIKNVINAIMKYKQNNTLIIQKMSVHKKLLFVKFVNQNR